MTEQEVRREIARVLRMCVNNGRQAYKDVLREVADALDPPEPVLLPCPFCSRKPSADGEGNVCCDEHTIRMPYAIWNRRAEVKRD